MASSAQLAEWSAPHLAAYLVNHAGDDAELMKMVRKRPSDVKRLSKLQTKVASHVPQALHWNTSEKIKDLEFILREAGVPAQVFDHPASQDTIRQHDFLGKLVSWAEDPPDLHDAQLGARFGARCMRFAADFAVEWFPGAWEDDPHTADHAARLSGMVIPGSKAFEADERSHDGVTSVAIACLLGLSRAFASGSLPASYIANEVLAPCMAATERQREAFDKFVGLLDYVKSVTHLVDVVNSFLCIASRKVPAGAFDPYPDLVAELRADVLTKNLQAPLAEGLQGVAAFLTSAPGVIESRSPSRPAMEAVLGRLEYTIKDAVATLYHLISGEESADEAAAMRVLKKANSSASRDDRFKLHPESVAKLISAYYELHQPGALASQCGDCVLWDLVQLCITGAAIQGISGPDTPPDVVHYDSKTGMYWAAEPVITTLFRSNPHVHIGTHQAAGQGESPRTSTRRAQAIHNRTGPDGPLFTEFQQPRRKFTKAEQRRLHEGMYGPPPELPARACAVCGAGGKLMKCSRCESAWYCSVDHQRQHYSIHRPDCKKLAEVKVAKQRP